MKIDKKGKVQLSEKDIRNQVRRYLAGYGLYISKLKTDTPEDIDFVWWHAQSALSYHGIPDMQGCYRGQDFWIETKAPGKEPKGRQKKMIAMLRYHGRQVFVVDDLDEFIREWETWVKVHPSGYTYPKGRRATS